MKINYHSVTGEIFEVEVDESIGNYILELDRQEFNNNHAETRRHCSLEEYDLDHNLLASGENIEEDFLKKESDQELLDAISKLDDHQIELLKSIYLYGKSQSDIAKADGVSKAAITYRLQVIYKKMKKFL